MATHRNNAVHVRRWKEKHREVYFAANRKCSSDNYYSKKQDKECLGIDPSLFS